EQPRDEITSALLKMPKHTHLIFETFLRILAQERLVHPPVVPDADPRECCVFDFTHAALTLPVASRFGKNHVRACGECRYLIRKAPDEQKEPSCREWGRGFFDPRSRFRAVSPGVFLWILVVFSK